MATRKQSPKSTPAPQASSTQTAASPKQLIERLEQAVPEALCELNHQNPWELLVATILSAQSTDRTVNAVTPELFRRWPTPEALASAEQEDVEQVIKRTGFFRSKAKSIRGTAQLVKAAHGGQVPRSLQTLITFPGVARKTANVVLGTGFGIASGFVVDTHVSRVAGRLGLSAQQEPAKIEADLCRKFARERWVDMSHRVLLHGRYTCLAKTPLCAQCPLNELCPSRKEPSEGTWEERAKAEAQRVATGRAG
jgi:endonuclease-3